MKSTNQLVEELFDLLHVKDNMNIFRNSMLDVYLNENKDMIKYKDEILKFIDKHAGYEALKDEIINLYIEIFDKEELEKLIEFYSTSVGQKTCIKLPELSTKIIQICSSKIENNIEELEKIFDFDD